MAGSGPSVSAGGRVLAGRLRARSKKPRPHGAGVESLSAVTHLGSRSGRKSGGRRTARTNYTKSIGLQELFICIRIHPGSSRRRRPEAARSARQASPEQVAHEGLRKRQRCRMAATCPRPDGAPRQSHSGPDSPGLRARGAGSVVGPRRSSGGSSCAGLGQRRAARSRGRAGGGRRCKSSPRDRPAGRHGPDFRAVRATPPAPVRVVRRRLEAQFSP